MHSGGMGDFKIECGSLTDEDLETFALRISKSFIFSAVHGVSRVGFPIASALQKYCTRAAEARLIVDDMLTTGLAMEIAKKKSSRHRRCPLCAARGLTGCGRFSSFGTRSAKWAS
jgi:hypothetical protein